MADRINMENEKIKVADDNSKWNWKKSLNGLKKTGEEMFSLVCIFITVTLIFFTQSEKQIQTLGIVFNDGNWVLLTMALIGFVAVSAVVEKLIKIIFWLIKTLY